jgi:hypothetical protein
MRITAPERDETSAKCNEKIGTTYSYPCAIFLYRLPNSCISMQNIICHQVTRSSYLLPKFHVLQSRVINAVLYGCETWSLTLREEHRLGVFKNGMLRRIFGPKKDEVMGGWRELHDEELHNLYYSPSIIRKVEEDEMVRHVARNGAERNAYRILVGKPEGKRPLGRPRH